MPISLPAMDRRRFLQGVLATGAAASLPVTLSSVIRADTVQVDQDVWAFLSDTHIPGDRNATGGKPEANPVPVKPVEHFEQVRADVLSGGAGNPCGVIVSGDCVYLKGKSEDYVTLLDEFKPFREAGMPVHFVMGNHDNRQAFLHAVADEAGQPRPDETPDRLCSIVETPRVNFFFLDSLETTASSPGLFGESQLDWLADELDSRKDKPAILVAHHYPDYTAAIASNPHALKDTEAFFERIRDRRQVKAYVFGHSHLWKILRKNGIHLVNIPATAWRFDIRQPYAWVLMKLRDDGMSLTLRSIDTEHPKHNEVVDLVWREA